MSIIYCRRFASEDLSLMYAVSLNQIWSKSSTLWVLPKPIHIHQFQRLHGWLDSSVSYPHLARVQTASNPQPYPPELQIRQPIETFSGNPF